MPEVIRVEGLVKEFEQRAGRFGRRTLHAVDGVTLAVDRGDSIGVVGESGCGKSTLARMMVGLEPPTAGTVLHAGDPVGDRAGWKALRRSVQYVFQDPYGSLPPRLSIGALLDDALRINGVSDERERRERVERAVELVGMRARDLDRLPSEFSGGQRQRISVARALILDPQVILFDEVTSGLDVSIQAQVLNLLVELQDRLGLGYVLISHDLRVVSYLTRTVAVMYLGRIVELGPVAEVFASPLHPYTRGLLQSIPDHGSTRAGAPRRRLARIQGEPPSPVDRPAGCAFAPRCPRAEDHCRAVDPPESTVDGRTVRCHFPGEVAAPAAAMAAGA